MSFRWLQLPQLIPKILKKRPYNPIVASDSSCPGRPHLQFNYPLTSFEIKFPPSSFPAQEMMILAMVFKSSQYERVFFNVSYQQ